MESSGADKRRFPRRPLSTPVGVLLDGKYSVYQSFDVGEKGLGISSSQSFEKGRHVIVSFFINRGQFVVCQGITRYCQLEGEIYKVGFELSNIRFEDRRVVRDYIADTTGALEKNF